MKFSIPSDSEDEIASETEKRLSRSQEILTEGKMVGESARLKRKGRQAVAGTLLRWPGEARHPCEGRDRSSSVEQMSRFARQERI